MITPAPDHVSVHREGDTFVVGEDPGAAAGVVVLPVKGGTFVVDPINPRGPGQLRVPGPPDLEVVEALFGTAVADAVSGRLDPAQNAVVGLAQSHERSTLGRLGTVRWLQQASPLALDERLLRVEGLVLEASIADLLEPEEAAETLHDWVPSLVAWAHRCAAPDLDVAVGPEFLDLVSDGLAEALATLPTSASASASGDASAGLAAYLRAGLATARRRVPDAPRLPCGPIDALRPQTRAGQTSSRNGQLHGSATVGWTRVPRGLTTQIEDGASWRVDTSPGKAHVSVVVTAPTADPTLRLLDVAGQPGRSTVTPALRATLTHPEWMLPLAVIELNLRPETECWLGVEALGPAVLGLITGLDPTKFHMDLHVPGAGGRPRGGASASIDQATRWAVRGVSSVRLAAAYRAGSRAEIHRGACDAFALAGSLFGASPDLRDQRAAQQCCAAVRLLGGSRGSSGSSGSTRSTGIEVIDSEPELTVAERWYAAHLAAPR